MAFKIQSTDPFKPQPANFGDTSVTGNLNVTGDATISGVLTAPSFVASAPVSVPAAGLALTGATTESGKSYILDCSDIYPPPGGAAGARNLTLPVTAPPAGWHIRIVGSATGAVAPTVTLPAGAPSIYGVIFVIPPATVTFTVDSANRATLDIESDGTQYVATSNSGVVLWG